MVFLCAFVVFLICSSLMFCNIFNCFSHYLLTTLHITLNSVLHNSSCSNSLSKRKGQQQNYLEYQIMFMTYMLMVFEAASSSSEDDPSWPVSVTHFFCCAINNTSLISAQDARANGDLSSSFLKFGSAPCFTSNRAIFTCGRRKDVISCSQVI